MTNKTVLVPSISCGHCVATIQRELSELPGVKQVDGDPARHTVTVQFDPPASWELILSTLDEIGYPAKDA